ncbi:MmpL domain protein [Frankia canadensis]|uniref:MmpL domain protein n=1 Tax=Frankia canadensis TaxID=1836972 RepID=A0A2I2KR84_9ACTN|nr:MMPL family transporter [Frankia canadensis]SNQ48177.1 MmpL domain protein [Frankia canadensis]SOU55467.1 MmpL domain protein [Frankia canadensis]
MKQFARRVGDMSARRPKRTIAAWGLVAVLMLALAGTVGGSFIDDFVAPGSQSEKAMTLLEERFPDAAGGSATAVFAVPHGQRLEGSRAVVEATATRIGRVNHVVAVTNPFSAGAVSPTGRIGYAEIRFDVPTTEVSQGVLAAITDAMRPARVNGVQAELGGDAAFINADAQTSGIEVVGLAAALVVLVVAFGSVVAALVPIVLALVTVAAGVGGIMLLAGIAEVSSAAPTIGAMVGLGVGIDYALFIVARYRENRAVGQDSPSALSDAMASSGSAVLLAGGTVVVAMTALTLTGLGFLTSIGLSTSLVVMFAVASALTLLPALLSLLGDRVDAGRIPGRRGRASTGSAHTTAWWRFAHRVARRPWPYLLAAAAMLLALAAPALSMRTGFPDAGDDSPHTSHRRAYDLLADGFGPGVNAPLLIVADLRSANAGAGTGAQGGRDALPALAQRINADPGIATVNEPRFSPAGDTAVLRAFPTTAPADRATSDTLARIREIVPGNVAVSGLTAMTDDLTRQLTDTLPTFVAAILAASFLLLMVVFRSIAVPLKAALLNLLSIGAAYGVVVAVFQWGWFGGLFGLDDTYLIASPLPTIFFAVLFGLSIDYEVFLLSRIREEYVATGDSSESVARGMAGTGRVITSAALIMTVVFLGFVANPAPMVRMLGLGLASAIVLDATLVRMVLVPATMALLGRANWWLPRWLDRLLPGARSDGAGVPPQSGPELVNATTAAAIESPRARLMHSPMSGSRRREDHLAPPAAETDQPHFHSRRAS